MSTALGVLVLIAIITFEMAGILRELKKIHRHLNDKEEDKKNVI